MTTPDTEQATAISVPRAAATILLLREVAAQVEVLMVRRHANLAFMAGMWVFPGGSLHAADSSDDALALLDLDAVTRRMNMLDLQGGAMTAKQAAGLVFAACRETFEETGVLLAKTSQGEPPAASMIEQLQTQRTAVSKDANLFIGLLQQHSLRLDLTGLAYWAHWITPSGAPRRFDTRFFIVRAPAADLASADTGETVDSIWMTPSALLEAAQRRDMPISHPTQCNLHDLQTTLTRYHSLDELLSAEASRSVMPILPKMFRDQDRTTIVMPWDATYATSPGEGMIATDCGALAALPSRIVTDR